MVNGKKYFILRLFLKPSLLKWRKSNSKAVLNLSIRL
jgi:hypothetical protein